MWSEPGVGATECMLMPLLMGGGLCSASRCEMGVGALAPACNVRVLTSWSGAYAYKPEWCICLREAAHQCGRACTIGVGPQ
jgi:hypothetical protein